MFPKARCIWMPGAMRSSRKAWSCTWFTPIRTAGTTDAVRFQGKESLADVRIFSVADTSSAAEIVTSREDLTVGDIAYLDIQSVHLRETKSDAAESENYPVVMTFSYGDPLDEEVRAAKASVVAPPIENQIRGRLGFDVGKSVRARRNQPRGKWACWCKPT